MQVGLKTILTKCPPSCLGHPAGFPKQGRVWEQGGILPICCHPLGRDVPPTPGEKTSTHTRAEGKSQQQQSNLGFESGFVFSVVDLTPKASPEASRGAVHTGEAQHFCLPCKDQAQKADFAPKPPLGHMCPLNGRARACLRLTMPSSTAFPKLRCAKS